MAKKKVYDLDERIYNFALEIINIIKKIPKSIIGFELGKQLFKAGTSIAANYEEAVGAFSKNDFSYKISISFKEARETHLWSRLLRDSKILNLDLKKTINEATEIRNILGKSAKTCKSKNKGIVEF